MPEMIIDLPRLNEGEMRRCEVDGKAVLISFVNGEYHVTGCKCSHYEAPLENGLIKGHSLMCPWHHACFDILTSTRLEPPGINDLPRFAFQIEGNKLAIMWPEENSVEIQGRADPSDPRLIVIIGGGAAGHSAAEELRRSGFMGRITIINDGDSLPVDRPSLSKEYLAGTAEPALIPLRKDLSWYDSRDIEFLLNSKAASVDPTRHKILLQNRSSLSYHKLFLAMGAFPRAIPGITPPYPSNVFTLRSLSDTDHIIAALKSVKRAVVIGASFIGMETAAALKTRGLEVTVVGIEKIPFDRIFGNEIGLMFQTEHESHGVQFRLDNQVRYLHESGGNLTGVELKSGEILSADLAVIGVGVLPATDFLEGSGFQMSEKDGSVIVNQFMETNQPDVYAGGDIARIGDVRIEHWRVAQQHGMIAARNMMGMRDSMERHVPFFWTNQWDLYLHYTGHAEKWDRIIWRGDAQSRNFSAFFMSGSEVLAACGCERDMDICAAEFIIRDRIPVTDQQLSDPGFSLMEHLKKNKTSDF